MMMMRKKVESLNIERPKRPIIQIRNPRLQKSSQIKISKHPMRPKRIMTVSLMKMTIY